MTPTKWSDFEPYLSPAHLAKPVKAKIAGVVVTKFYSNGRSFEKPVLTFSGARKGLIVSTAIRKQLAEAFGDDIAACFGQTVELRAENQNGQAVITLAPVSANGNGNGRQAGEA